MKLLYYLLLLILSIVFAKYNLDGISFKLTMLNNIPPLLLRAEIREFNRTGLFEIDINKKENFLMKEMNSKTLTLKIESSKSEKILYEILNLRFNLSLEKEKNGFGFSPLIDDKFFLPSLLRNQGIIRNEIFLIEIENDENIIYMGVNKDNIIFYPSYYFSLRLIERKENWNIKIDYMMIENLEKYTFNMTKFGRRQYFIDLSKEENLYLPINSTVYLSYHHNEIFVNKKILTFLKKNLFSSFLSEGTCDTFDFSGFQGFVCKEKLHFDKKLHFFSGNFSFSMHIENFFIKNDIPKKNKFQKKFAFVSGRNDEITFGISFLKNFLVSFDKKKEKIGFYSTNNVEFVEISEPLKRKNSSSVKSILKCVFSINIIIMIINLMILIILKDIFI